MKGNPMLWHMYELAKCAHMLKPGDAQRVKAEAARTMVQSTYNVRVRMHQLRVEFLRAL